MKLRLDYVTNSSSSSYTVLNIKGKMFTELLSYFIDREWIQEIDKNIDFDPVSGEVTIANNEYENEIDFGFCPDNVPGVLNRFLDVLDQMFEFSESNYIDGVNAAKQAMKQVGKEVAEDVRSIELKRVDSYRSYDWQEYVLNNYDSDSDLFKDIAEYLFEEEAENCGLSGKELINQFKDRITEKMLLEYISFCPGARFEENYRYDKENGIDSYSKEMVY